MQRSADDAEAGFLAALAGDGRPLLGTVALCLMLAGTFAIFQCATGHFLPHDEQYLGMDKEQLCGINQCRIVHFMFHDRVSFGGALVSIGLLYLWLIQFPLRQGEPWAWWAFAFSGLTGFGSFLAYLGYGYLDTWHGAATLALLPLYLGGMAASWRSLPRRSGPGAILAAPPRPSWRTRFGIGHGLLLATSAGLLLGGATIMIVGMTSVFVPQDLRFMGLRASELEAIHPNLVPLIAHDRAGFGGAIGTCGLILFLCLWRGRPSRSLWQAVVMACSVGFACAIGVHPLIGYTEWTHLAPAYAGVVMFVVGAWLCHRGMRHAGWGRNPD